MLDHISIGVRNIDAARRFGRDNGKPGLRADYGENYYAAFVVDPDGFRIEAHCGK